MINAQVKSIDSRSNLMINVYTILLIMVSSCMSSSIEYYINYSMHEQVYHPNMIKNYFDIPIEKYNLVYANIAFIMYNWMLFTGILLFYIIFKPIKNKSLSEYELKKRTFIACILNIAMPGLYIVFPNQNIRLSSSLVCVNTILYGLYKKQ